VRRQTYGYIPSLGASPPFDRYQIIDLLLGEQRHMCVNNLPKVVTRQCPGAESNLCSWVTSGLQVRHVTVRLPSHTSCAFASTECDKNTKFPDSRYVFHAQYASKLIFGWGSTPESAIFLPSSAMSIKPPPVYKLSTLLDPVRANVPWTLWTHASYLPDWMSHCTSSCSSLSPRTMLTSKHRRTDT